jgi:LDH2 family malate/lactate/ureidoglycolate dehydrogenase
MNQPPENFRRIAATHLQTFAAACLKSAGMTDEHAAQLAELLTNSDRRGVRSHGTRALHGYCRSIRDNNANPNPNIQVIRETDTHVLSMATAV